MAEAATVFLGINTAFSTILLSALLATIVMINHLTWHSEDHQPFEVIL